MDKWTKLDVIGMINWVLLIVAILLPIKLPHPYWGMFEMVAWAMPLLVSGTPDWVFPEWITKCLEILAWIAYGILIGGNLYLISLCWRVI
jgi:hypothetical protein